jgi:hypothetical protein
MKPFKDITWKMACKITTDKLIDMGVPCDLDASSVHVKAKELDELLNNPEKLNLKFESSTIMEYPDNPLPQYSMMRPYR